MDTEGEVGGGPRTRQASPLARLDARVIGPDWPADWAARQRYLPWQARPRRNGRTGKCPVGRDGRPCDPLEPRGWRSWTDALACVARGEADGVGLVVTPALRLTVLDLDDCVTPAGLTPAAQAVIEEFAGSYVESSPSGRGLHVLVRGACPDGWRRRPGLDVITTGFVTVTGRAWRGGVPVTRPDQQGRLADWHARHAPVSTAHLASGRAQSSRAPAGDWFRRACQARNGARFQALWAGELAGSPSASEADLRLTLMLLYWQPQLSDAELGALLLSSGRAREKLADPHYLRRTIAAARRYRVA